MATSLKNSLFHVTKLDVLLIISKLNVQLITERKVTNFFSDRFWYFQMAGLASGKCCSVFNIDKCEIINV